LITKRVGSDKEYMGLTTWKGEVITSADAKVAKNYLQEIELRRLQLLVEQFLSFAELCSLEQIPMYMSDWIKKLDGFLLLNEKKILEGSGTVSRKSMEHKVREELKRYKQNLKGQKQITG